jgi:NADPH2:quinone reductase
MKAAIITKPGGPEVLRIEDRPTPSPRPNEILVRVRASALNRADLHQREGNYPAPAGSPPDIPGLEFAGEVAELGADVTHLRKGQRVFGIVGGGANAEYLVTDARCVAGVPDALSWTDAAAVPEAFITAYDALVTQANVQVGERVLIHAVGSGVGLAAVQIAALYDASPCGTARTADKIERAKDYGLLKGVVLGDDPDAMVAPLKEWSRDRGIDVTLDLVGGPYLPASIRAAALHGRIICIGTVAGRTASVPVGMILGKRLTLRGTVMRARPLDEKRVVTAAFDRDIVPYLGDRLRPVVDSVYDLGDIRRAHERLASNETFGKVVIVID